MTERLNLTALLRCCFCPFCSLCVLSSPLGAGVGQSVAEGGLLVGEGLAASELASRHADFATALVDQRQFQAGFTLGYITPWNNHGYDVAKKVSLTRGRSEPGAKRRAVSDLTSQTD